MKPDLYTKFALSVIAVALLWLCVQNTLRPSAVLAQGPTKVIIAGIEYPGGVPVKLMGGTKANLVEVSGGNPLPVAVIP